MQTFASAERSASPPPRKESLAPAPAEEFLRQALGSNQSDARFPAALLTTALLLAVIAVSWRRWRKRRGQPDAG